MPSLLFLHMWTTFPSALSPRPPSLSTSPDCPLFLPSSIYEILVLQVSALTPAREGSSWPSQLLWTACLCPPTTPTKFMCWKCSRVEDLTFLFQCNGIRRWSLWVVMRLWRWRLHEGINHHKKIQEREFSPLSLSLSASASLPIPSPAWWRYSKKAASCKQARGLPLEPRCADITILNFQPPELWIIRSMAEALTWWYSVLVARADWDSYIKPLFLLSKSAVSFSSIALSTIQLHNDVWAHLFLWSLSSQDQELLGHRHQVP